MPSAEENMLLYRFTQLVVLAVLSPLWYPVAKAMWMELRAALIPEGGLFGRPPSEAEIQRLQQELGDFDTPLHSEPFSERIVPRSAGPTRSGVSGRGAARPRGGNAPATRDFRRARR